MTSRCATWAALSAALTFRLEMRSDRRKRVRSGLPLNSATCVELSGGSVLFH
ncbi:hypothetical protein PR003_g2934 [Phytophthora rubi]|uniref:Uncharacterized protein n=1 Tax=Phytophthora rubi TaxID=129364 RepID=A0A6A3NYE9_9STRA|nr:hypothetical protein PR002_g554 [Phytophthora rubi]KAE9052489.1 hypothetical protein PR001_g465 [Phytophthora rubi]KAE9355262.1 hypothetical protein PR003_g2934 [Phytophthora rubi]